MIDIILSLIAVVLAITLHEAAHGYAALALGDDTAKKLGRLSLNPLAHVDRMGTLIVPGILVIGQLLTIGRIGFLFGWAKPVPVAAWRFRNPRQGMAVVAAAGPATNFALAWLAGLALQVVALPDWVACYGFDVQQLQNACLALNMDDPGDPAGRFLHMFILSNLVLGLFNLLPIPPLDGGRIAVGILPENLARAWDGMERAGIVVVLLLVFLLPMAAREFGYQFDPVGAALDRVLPWAIRMVLLASGHGGDV
jgi:Zn-dependent protease